MLIKQLQSFYGYTPGEVNLICSCAPADMQRLETGILTTLSQEPSRRAFLQKLFDSGNSALLRNHFLKCLHQINQGKTFIDSSSLEK